MLRKAVIIDESQIDSDTVTVGCTVKVYDTDFEEELQDKATSLYKENYNVSRVDIVKEILCQFEKLYLDYIEKDDKKEVLAYIEYKKQSV